MIRTLLSSIALIVSGCATAAPARTPAACRATHDGRPHETLKPATGDVLVSREIAFEVPGSPDRFVPAFLKEKLATFIRGHGNLPAVDHTEALTAALYPTPGSVRLVCLADGNTADEEVLEQDERHLRYLVTNYSSPEAGPIAYGIGEFTFEPGGGPTAATHVRWRYGFKLRSNRFPGYLGGLGRSLFRSNFLESDYGPFMDHTARDIRAFAERVVAGSPVTAVEQPPL